MTLSRLLLLFGILLFALSFAAAGDEDTGVTPDLSHDDNDDNDDDDDDDTYAHTGHHEDSEEEHFTDLADALDADENDDDDEHHHVGPLTPDLEAKLKKTFELVDANHDSVLELKEIKNFLHRRHEKMERKHHDSLKVDHADVIKTMIADADKNADGELDWSEYWALKNAELAEEHDNKPAADLVASTQTREEKFFKLHDKNNNGKLDPTEYSDVVYPNYKRNSAAANHVVDEAMAARDTDKDNRISLEEHMNEYHAAGHSEDDDANEEIENTYFTEHDTNSDGFLSKAELHNMLFPDESKWLDEEAKHLIEMAEAHHPNESDRDGKVNFAELKKNHEDILASTMHAYAHEEF